MLLEDYTVGFVIRIWLEHREIEDSPVAWRGSIEHVASRRIRYLTDLREIPRFMQPFLEEIGIVTSQANSNSAETIIDADFESME